MGIREYADFSAGIVTDAPPYAISPKALVAAQDVLLRDDGTIIKRGGMLTALSAASTIRPEHVAILDSNEADNLTTGIIYDEFTGGVGAPINVAAFTPSAANFPLSTSLALAIANLNDGSGWATPTVPSGSNSGGGRPARYFNRILRPNGIPASLASAAHQYRPFSIFAGAPFVKTTSRTSASVITLTQGDPVLTGFSAADTAAVEVGMIGRFSDATHAYTGRVVAIPSATTIQFAPAPTLGLWTTAAGAWVITPIYVPNRKLIASPIIGARALTVWGDRVVLGGVAYDMLNAGTKMQVHGNRLAWGILPAIDSGTVGTVTYDGFREGALDTFLTANFDDVMGIETIVGVEPVSQGELLVLGYPRIHRIVGYFSTQTTQQGGGLTWDVRPVQDAIPCIYDAATATTPIGIFFAGPDGVYLYRGGRAINTMEGRTRNRYTNFMRGGSPVSGGGYLGQNHYFISIGTLQLVCNFDHDSFRWTDMGAGTGLGQVVIDPARMPACYVTEKNSGGASTTGKLRRGEQIFQPGTGITLDPGGTTPNMTMRTKAFTEGDAAQLKVLKAVEITLKLKNVSAVVTVTVLPGLANEESSTTLGTIAGDATGLTRMVRFAVAPRIKSKAFSFRFDIAAGTTADEFQLIAVKLDTEPLNQVRST